MGNSVPAINDLIKSVLAVPLASLILLTISLRSLALSSVDEIFSSLRVSSSFGGGLGASTTLGATGVGVKDGTLLGVNELDVGLKAGALETAPGVKDGTLLGVNAGAVAAVGVKACA